jgi:hypothetical protein
MVLAANRKSKQQISADLQLFLGKHTEKFTNWLFEAFERIQKSETDAPEKRSPRFVYFLAFLAVDFSPEEVKLSKKEEKPKRSPSVELISTSSSRLRSTIVVPENSTVCLHGLNSFNFCSDQLL